MSKTSLRVAFILIALLLYVVGVNSANRGEPKLHFSNALIVHTASQLKQRKAAEFLQYEIERRTGIRLAISNSLPSGEVPAIVVGTAEAFPTSLALPPGLAVPAKAEGYAIGSPEPRKHRPRLTWQAVTTGASCSPPAV